MRFALRTNYGEGAIWLLQDKTVKFPFIEHLNTTKEQQRLLLSVCRKSQAEMLGFFIDMWYNKYGDETC